MTKNLRCGIPYQVHTFINLENPPHTRLTRPRTNCKARISFCCTFKFKAIRPYAQELLKLTGPHSA